VRGFARRSASSIGNFWVDLVRCTLYILLPISIVFGLFFVWQGMPQNLGAYTEATTLEGAKQVIAQGPVASQEVIKMLGTNGGGFFNANSAHPFENPNALTNFVQIVLIFSIGAALTNVFGRMVGDERQGWAVFAVMAVLFLLGVTTAYLGRGGRQPGLHAAPPQRRQHGRQGGPLRHRQLGAVATITTAASCGAVNAMHDSFTPLGGLVPLFNIQLGEIIVGGVGAGLYGMLLFAIISVFVAGLMVGRTPEYLGKKIEAREVKMAMLAILILPLSILGFTAIATWPMPASQAPPTRARTASARSSMPIPRAPATTARPSPASAPTRCSTTPPSARDVHRALPDDRADAGDRGLARGQEDRPGLGRHFPDPRRRVRRPGGRRDPDRRRSHLFPGARARPRGRALVDARRHAFLGDMPAGTAPRVCDPRSSAGAHRCLPQARSRADGAPRDVHGRGRRTLTTSVHPRP
jgi:hypothetical protein